MPLRRYIRGIRFESRRLRFGLSPKCQYKSADEEKPDHAKYDAGKDIFGCTYAGHDDGLILTGFDGLCKHCLEALAGCCPFNQCPLPKIDKSGAQSDCPLAPTRWGDWFWKRCYRTDHEFATATGSRSSSEQHVLHERSTLNHGSLVWKKHRRECGFITAAPSWRVRINEPKTFPIWQSYTSPADFRSRVFCNQKNKQPGEELSKSIALPLLREICVHMQRRKNCTQESQARPRKF